MRSARACSSPAAVAARRDARLARAGTWRRARCGPPTSAAARRARLVEHLRSPRAVPARALEAVDRVVQRRRAEHDRDRVGLALLVQVRSWSPSAAARSPSSAAPLRSRCARPTLLRARAPRCARRPRARSRARLRRAGSRARRARPRAARDCAARAASLLPQRPTPGLCAGTGAGTPSTSRNPASTSEKTGTCDDRATHGRPTVPHLAARKRRLVGDLARILRNLRPFSVARCPQTAARVLHL